MELLVSPIAVLKEEIEYTIGRKILSSRDCIDLSDAIWRKIECRISPNTLRRFFGLVKAEYSASSTTLCMLASYCGASSVDDLVEHGRRSKEHNGEEGALLLKYLNILFESIPYSKVSDTTSNTFAKTTVEFLMQNPSLAYKFQKTIAKTKSAKRFYFEQFVNVDNLDGYYGNGLRYYLAENRGSNAQILGHGLLCLRYWLTMDVKNLEYHYENLMKHTITEYTHFFTCARYFAAKLFYAEAKDMNTANIIAEANEFYKSIKPLDRYNNVACFEFVFAEALILTGHYYDAFVYTNEGYRRKLNNYGAGMEAELFKGFELYHTIVLYNIDNETKAAEIFGQINPLDFYFITKQFNTILYLITGVKLSKLRPAKRQLAFLVEKTGFKRLLRNQPKLV